MKAYRSESAEKVLADPKGRAMLRDWLQKNGYDRLECSDGTVFHVSYVPVHDPAKREI